ncbi:hypothetical protein FJ938_22330 [Mesorhizobium sp. B2-4-14]|uniref:hypothetical protein n=1 Tax=Mesorhizobium sp. B2-4-14 TaxID=2589935 RepID=UPI00112DDB97|nr:hypothetical protein [Mesorhizobium sp. B2-4-14]TPL00491.1 hypothetical protein FJ938_22330 [Mesorhizobium sp. B2-4-14]
MANRKATSGKCSPAPSKIDDARQPFNPYSFDHRVAATVYEERDDRTDMPRWRRISYEDYEIMCDLMEGTQSRSGYRMREPTSVWNDIRIFRQIAPLGMPVPPSFTLADTYGANQESVGVATAASRRRDDNEIGSHGRFHGRIFPPTTESRQPVYIDVDLGNWQWSISSDRDKSPKQFPDLLARLFPWLDALTAFDFAVALAGASAHEEYGIAQELWHAAMAAHAGVQCATPSTDKASASEQDVCSVRGFQNLLASRLAGLKALS